MKQKQEHWMNTEQEMQSGYKTAVNQWIEAIRAEEALAFAQPTVREEDIWEKAHFKEDEARNKAKQAKKAYEGAIRQNLFQF
jgi:hypothetical protein